MPLLMLDLDNTLIDRDAAFRAAAGAFLAEHALPATDLTWLTTLDASGYTPREEVARVMIERYDGSGGSSEYGTEGLGAAVHALLDGGAADRVTLAEATRDALREAVAAGWTCVIVGRAVMDGSGIRAHADRAGYPDRRPSPAHRLNPSVTCSPADPVRQLLVG
ncbi:hypothetical protein [Streptomyces sp. NPDC088794]|uniref:hypothetical protein n=1 Tax=Streptomyces sp. NPDC088794 TaxID=3365902 RepID=UPI0037FE1AA0